MANFIEPNTRNVKYRNAADAYRNDIINLDKCKRIALQEQRLQYDVDLPAIVFVGCDAKWVFLTEEEREKELDRILRSTWKSKKN